MKGMEVLMEKLEYLKKYRKEIEIFSGINDQIKSVIPNSWSDIFGTEDMQERIRKVLNIWRENVYAELTNTFLYLEQNIKTLDLISYNNKFFILYGIQMGTGEVDYFEGGNPLDCKENNLFIGMPEKLKRFYSSVHNGFYYFPSKLMGMVSIDRVTHFAESEWGILDDLEQPLQINLETTYGFYNNAGGVYIAIDYQNCENDNATIWYVDDEPEYNVNFWKEVDEWMNASFE